MRKALLIGLPVVLLGAAIAWFLMHGRNPIVQAKHRMAQGDMKGAELYLRQAIHEHPLNPEAAFLLGRVDLGLGNPAGAELELKRARERGYSPSAIVMPLGQAYLEQHHFDEALRDFVPDHAPPGSLADTLAIRAGAQLSLGQFDAAWASAQAAIAAGPNNRDVALTAARVALARNDTGNALSLAQKVLAADPKQPDALLLEAELDMQHGDARAALGRAQAVLAANPGRLDARMIEARAYAGIGDIDHARGSVGLVLKGSPKNMSANYLNAMLSIGAGDYTAADNSLTVISTALSQLPRGFYFLAVTKLGLGQPALAEEADTKFLAKEPNDVTALKLMAFIDLARRHPDRTLELLRQPPLSEHVDADTLDLQGRAQTMLGDMKDAKQSFTQALTLSPKDVQIINRLAAAELDLGDTNGALAGLQHSLEISPKQRLAGEALVQADLARGDMAQANADVERLRRAVGDIEEVGILAAQVKIASLDTAAGEAQLKDVLSRVPDSRQAALNLVRIYGLRGDKEDAEKLLEGLLHRRADDAGALELLLPVLFADKQFDLAMALAEAAHTANPDDVNITAMLAGAYVRAREPGRAVALLDRVSAETNPQLDVLRADVLVAVGKTSQAIDAYQAVLQEQPDNARVRGDLSGLLVAAGRAGEARDELREGLKKAPGNPLLLGALVGVDLKTGGLKQALATAAALRADPANAPAASGLVGDTYMAQNDVRHAADAYLAAYKTSPSSLLAVRASGAMAAAGNSAQAIALLAGWTASHPDDAAAISALSGLYLAANRLNDADTALHAVLAMRPRDIAALNNLAWLKQKQGDAAQARGLAERAYFETPIPEVADTLGWILVQQGEIKSALIVLAQAVSNANPASRASAEYHYAVALNQAGRRDEARAQLQLAVDSKASFADRSAAEQLLTTLK
jgi:putative PEP-CTERM system TPR-repeat lipoprotein